MARAADHATASPDAVAPSRHPGPPSGPRPEVEPARMPLTVVSHPLVEHRVAALRDPATPPVTFRQVTRELATFLAYEATRDLPTEPSEIVTALGVAEPWECVVSVLLGVAALLVLLRLGGRIYANAVLRTGARVKLTEALRRT